MGTRPPSLLPGATLRAAVIDHGNGRLILGQAMPGQFQLLLFERGHWCSSCRRHLALIADDAAEFARRRIDIVAITHEPVGELQGRIYPFPVIADPDLDIATAFDLVGVDEFGKTTIRPATVVVDDRGTIAFSYAGDDSRDRPTIPALLLALDNLI